MPEFPFPRFSDRHNLEGPTAGEVVDLYADDTEAGIDDECQLGPDLATVTRLQLRPGPGGLRRVYQVTE